MNARRVVGAKNVKDAMERAIAKERYPGTNLHDVTNVELIAEED